VSGGSLDSSGADAAFIEGCTDGTTDDAQVVDLANHQLLASLPGWGQQQLKLSPDGTSFVSQEVQGENLMGALAIGDLRTGAEKLKLQGICQYDQSLATPPEQQPGCAALPSTPFPFWARTIRWSPDGSMIAAIDANTQVTAVWDAHDGRLLHVDAPTEENGVADILFSPDSKLLLKAHPLGVLETVSTDTWTTVAKNQLDQSIFGLDSMGLVDYARDSSSILAVGGLGGGDGASIIWIDPTTLAATKSIANATIASPKSVALSPDGRTLSTGESDGSVRVWDAVTGQLLQQMQFGSQAQGVAYMDDTHLLVTPQTGNLLVMTIDPTELVDTVRASVTRPFTATECATYDIDPCPTLAQSTSREDSSPAPSP
jgi:WD40 repeat protein